MTKETDSSGQGIVLFDGDCNMCSKLVQFVLKYDNRNYFRFAPLESDAAKSLCKDHLDLLAIDSMLLAEEGRIFTRSTAALRIIKRLRWPWSWVFVLILAPRPIRDAVYRWIARHRIGWFGKADVCRLVTPEMRGRFLT